MSPDEFVNQISADYARTGRRSSMCVITEEDWSALNLHLEDLKLNFRSEQSQFPKLYGHECKGSVYGVIVYVSNE